MRYKFFVNELCRNKFSQEIISLLVHLVKNNSGLKEIKITSRAGIVRLKYFDKEIFDSHYKKSAQGVVKIKFKGENCYLQFSEAPDE